MPNYGIPYANGLGQAPDGGQTGAGNGGWSTGEKWGAGLLGGGLLAGLMGNSGAPYGAAEDQLKQYYNQGLGYLSPYATAGSGEVNPLNDAASQLMNPEQLQAEWSKSYQTSPEAKAIEQQATQQGLGDASSMGLLGSSPALQAIQAGTSNIGLQDRQNYMDQLMNKYQLGVNTRMGMFNAGGNAAANIGNMSSTMGNTMANLAYNKSAAPSSMLGSILGGLGGGALGFFTGGGPLGALKGASMGSSLGGSL